MARTKTKLEERQPPSIEALMPYFKGALAAVIVVVVLVAVWLFTSRQRQAQSATAWTELTEGLAKVQLNASPLGMGAQIETSRSREALEDVVRKYPRSTAALWAKAHLGRLQVVEGNDLLFKDRASAREELQGAVANLKAVLDEAYSNELKQFATYWLAGAYESLGELDAARSHYEALARQWPNGMFAAMAQQQVQRLERTAVREWYDWFAEQRTELPGPGDPGMPGFRPGNEPSDFPDPHAELPPIDLRPDSVDDQ